MNIKRIIATAALTIAAATTAAGCGTITAGHSCSGPYQPVIVSGSYLRVTANGHGVHSDAARSNYRCDNGRLVVTVPWNGS